MSYSISDFINCEDLQDRIEGKFTSCDYTQTLKPNETSLVQVLQSPLNTNGSLQQQVASGDGKLKTVNLIYTPRIPAESVGTSIDRGTCTAEIKQGQRVKAYTLDETEGVSISRVIDLDDLIRFCRSNPEYLTETLMQMMDAATRQMDRVIASDIIALAGKFGAGETGVVGDVKTVRTRKASSQDLSMNFIEEISFASENAGYCAPAIAFGWGELYKAWKALDASNCCADNGTNLALLNNLAGTSFVANRNVPLAYGNANNFYTIDAGAVQILKYNRFLAEDGGISKIDSETVKQTVILHPQTGLPFDLRMYFNCGKWSIFVELAFKTVGLPDDVYFAGDIYDGVTGVNQYVINNA